MKLLSTISLALCSAPFAAAQDLPQIARDPATQRAFFARDWMIGVAGNEVILRTDLDYEILSDRDLSQRLRQGDMNQRQAVYDEALGKRLETLLRVQAGLDLGFDPAVVEQLTEANFQRRIEELGGAREASKLMKQENMNPERFKAQIKDSLLGMVWYRAETGQAQGPTGRLAMDRYLRPGVLYSSYAAFANSTFPTERMVVGAQEPSFRIQQLRIPVGPDQAVGDIEELAKELKRMFDASEVEFDFLVRTYGDPGSQENLGKTQPLPLNQLSRFATQVHGDSGEALGELLRSGKLGGSTTPLFRSNPDCWVVYQLLEARPASPAQPFGSKTVQGSIRAYLLENLDRARSQQAFSEVVEASFVFPSEFRPFLLARNKKVN